MELTLNVFSGQVIGCSFGRQKFIKPLAVVPTQVLFLQCSDRSVEVLFPPFTSKNTANEGDAVEQSHYSETPQEDVQSIYSI